MKEKKTDYGLYVCPVMAGKARLVTAQCGNNSTNLPPHWGPDCYLRQTATTGFGNVVCERIIDDGREHGEVGVPDGEGRRERL